MPIGVTLLCSGWYAVVNIFGVTISGGRMFRCGTDILIYIRQYSTFVGHFYLTERKRCYDALVALVYLYVFSVIMTWNDKEKRFSSVEAMSVPE